MSSGYTADVANGKITTFREFAMRCARAMGACITMREDPIDADIPEAFEPSQYHREQSDKAKIELAEYRALTNVELMGSMNAEYEAAMSRWRESIVRKSAEQSRYEQMLDDVKEWKPPTDEHKGLKKFMLDQLRESVKSDCGYPWPEPTRPNFTSSERAREAREKGLRQTIAHHDREQVEEDERAVGQTEWIKQLRASL